MKSPCFRAYLVSAWILFPADKRDYARARGPFVPLLGTGAFFPCCFPCGEAGNPFYKKTKPKVRVKAILVPLAVLTVEKERYALMSSFGRPAKSATIFE